MRGIIYSKSFLQGSTINQNGQTTFIKEIPIGEAWNTLQLRFNHTVVIGTGAGAIEGSGLEGLLVILKNLLFRSSAGEQYVNLPGRALNKFATYMIGTNSPLRDTLAAASATYRTYYPIFFTDPRLPTPFNLDTILNTAFYTSLTLQITYGGLADLYTAPGTATLAVTMDAEYNGVQGLLPKNAWPKAYVEYDFRQPIDASVATLADLKHSTDMSNKRIMVHSCTSGTSGQPFSGTNSDAIQNLVKVIDQNGDIFPQRIHDMVQKQNAADYSFGAILAGMELFDFTLMDSSLHAIYTGDKSTFQYVWTNQGAPAANSLISVMQQSIRRLSSVPVK